MKAYLQVPSEAIPFIRLDPENNYFEISGRSIPIDADRVFCDVLQWFDNFACVARERVKLVIKLEYFNLASSKRLLLVFYKLKKMRQAGTNVIVQWVYDESDTDMLEIGKDYASLVEEISFEFKPLNSQDFQETDRVRFG